jgi:hypothetical protein
MNIKNLSLSRLKFPLTLSNEYQKDSIFGALVMLLTLQMMGGGYRFGYGEQVVLSLKGLDWFDKSNWQNDWFTHNAPQPHVVFDLITFLGNSLSALEITYFLYFVLSLYVFALATSVLWRNLPFHFLKESPPIYQQLINATAVIGPSFILGTYLTISNQALPNMLGGALSYLAIALLLTNKTEHIGIVALFVSFTHIQHGIAICLLVLVCGILDRQMKNRLTNIWFSAVGIVWAVGIGLYRRTFLGGAEIAGDISQTGSISHFNVKTWTTLQILIGLALMCFSLIFILIVKKISTNKTPRLTALFLILAACILFVAVIAGRFYSDEITSAFRSLFVYRVSMYLMPFSIWFWAFVFFPKRKTFLTKAISITLAALILCLLLCFPAETFSKLSLLDGATLVALSTIMYLYKETKQYLKLNRIVRVMLSVICLAAFAATLRPQMFKLGFDPNDKFQEIGSSINLALGPEEILASDPEMDWLRITSRTSIVVDCKGTPYGGNAWFEYKRRLQYLGVENPSECKGFHNLTPNQILEIHRGTAATSILLTPDDHSYKWASRQLPIIWQSSESKDAWRIFKLPK